MSVETLNGEFLPLNDTQWVGHRGARNGYAPRTETCQCSMCGDHIWTGDLPTDGSSMEPLPRNSWDEPARYAYYECAELQRQRNKQALGTVDEHARRVRLMDSASAPTKYRHAYYAGIEGYHDGNRSVDDTSEACPFLVGFEVEKEDEHNRYEIDEGEMDLPNGWTVEEDGSLDDGGHEIITCAYNLRHWPDIVNDANYAADALNGGSSSSCGGHINISDRRYGGRELLRRLRPFLPLFLALYPKRLKSDYVCAKKFSYTMRNSATHDHYQPFNYRSDRCEFRIPSAVKSMDNYLWRAQLIRIMLMASYEGPITWEWMAAALRDGGIVREHLSQVYTDPKVLKHRIHLYWSFAEFYYTDKSNKYVTELLQGVEVRA